jgi:hypothetical protein
MSTAAYESILQLADSLSREEKLRSSKCYCSSARFPSQVLA